MQPLIQLKATSPLLITLALLCFGLSPTARAVLPPPDGGYPGFTTAEGQNALFSLTTGSANMAVGWFSLFSNAKGSFNTATGAGSLLFNTADNNTAFGVAALLFNTFGINNTAVGTAALLNNTAGNGNTALGDFALPGNTDGSFNTAVGERALFHNTTAGGNTATGAFALTENTTGDNNTANGLSALGLNSEGHDNTAAGAGALFGNTTGIANTAVGNGALADNSGGNNNIALGFHAGGNLTTGSNNIDIGAFGVAAESNTIRIGVLGTHAATYIAGIFGQTSSGGTAVFINSDGRLGTMTSSRSSKDEIQLMQGASEVIYALKPVTFRYKKDIDPARTSQFGLVAEDVEKINPDLVVRDKEGKPYSVRYDQVNAMLLNEFLKEHRKNETQETTIAELKAEIATLSATVKAQAEQIQKVSAQVEASKPAPQVVNNP
jgi:Chaperone of endosialidase